jgi:hypothetical protein
MRLTLAPTSALTDARGHNEKARSLSAWLRQAIRAVVSLSDKPTGESVVGPAPVFTSTHPVTRTASKLARSLSLRRPSRSRHGATNEHSSLRSAGSHHRGSY